MSNFQIFSCGIPSDSFSMLLKNCQLAALLDHSWLVWRCRLSLALVCSHVWIFLPCLDLEDCYSWKRYKNQHRSLCILSQEGIFQVCAQILCTPSVNFQDQVRMWRVKHDFLPLDFICSDNPALCNVNLFYPSAPATRKWAPKMPMLSPLLQITKLVVQLSWDIYL